MWRAWEVAKMQVEKVTQIAIILSFIEDGEELDDQEDETMSTTWFDAINRGGLFKCTNDFYKLTRSPIGVCWRHNKPRIYT